MHEIDAVIWGTVSDWCMVVVTAITAYYLYKTLQSQKEVQTTQAKLYEIESVRFRESIKPKLSYAISQHTPTPDDESKEVITIEVANETDSLALEVTSEYGDSDSISRIFFPDFRRNHIIKGDKPLFVHFLVDRSPKVMVFIAFAMTYKDVSGVKYKQPVLCIKDGHGTDLNAFLPEIVD